MSAAGLVDTQRIHVDYVIDDPYTLEVVSEPETLYASSAMPDSSEISVILRDPNGQGVEEYQIYLSTSGGSLDRIPESDSTGRASTWWHSDGEYGTFHITAYAWELTDTAWVTILPYPVGSVQIVCEDTLYILPGDSGLTPAVVIVTNTEGHVMPGKEVNITLANPLIGMLEFIDTALYDTTNQYGRVEMWYRAYHIGQNVISANCDGVSDFATILTLYP